MGMRREIGHEIDAGWVLLACITLKGYAAKHAIQNYMIRKT